jgi:hypothetical protein
MIILKVKEEDKTYAKLQIKEFEKIKEGSWRYSDVEAWR